MPDAIRYHSASKRVITLNGDAAFIDGNRASGLVPNQKLSGRRENGIRRFRP
jgi:hypothetical protein